MSTPPLGGCTGIMPEDATDGNMHTGALEGSGFGSGGGNFMQLILNDSQSDSKRCMYRERVTG